MDLRWRASLSASCFHAARAIALGQPLVDNRLAQALSPSVASLSAELSASGISFATFFEQVVPLAADFENNRELARRVLARFSGRSEVQNEQAAGRLAGWFNELESAFSAAVSGVVDELTLRGRPLREQWEARGPGLLAAIGRLTEPGVLAEGGEVVLVYPVQGGGGAAHLAYNKVSFEAVLANPIVELPETVRLGWLLSTLNLDLPKYSEALPRQRLDSLAPLAMLPAALAAAQDVELVHGVAPSLAHAMTVWRVVQDDDDIKSLADMLDRWWKTYQERRPPWAVALAALEQMLPARTE